MSIQADNAIIMAAGLSSRFLPLSYEKPKALIEVLGEVLIERQIRQLKASGINDIIIVTGYKANMFEYLKEAFGVKLIFNPEYMKRNNNYSIYLARKYLKNSYICSADNYFNMNPFSGNENSANYSSIYQSGPSNEWFISTDENNNINSVKIGGNDGWIMLGPAFWDASFSSTFSSILEESIDQVANKLWEEIYLEHIDRLNLKIKKFPNNTIFEFDSIDDLEKFDPSYKINRRSKILKNLANDLNVHESDFYGFKPFFNPCSNLPQGFIFLLYGKKYKYDFKKEKYTKVEE